MISKTLTVPGVLLIVMAAFQLTAAFATFIPSFVHDRVPEQFIPVWLFLAGPVLGDAPSEDVIRVLAVASQLIIGISEAVIGLALLAAALVPQRRLTLANFGLAYAAGLFGAFLLTMFAMHDPQLPKWNQYPAILAWIGATWLVVALTSDPRCRTAE